MCSAFLPGIIEAGRGGRVVNLASDAERVGSAGETIYAGAKGGVIAPTKSLAREMARHQITVNCVCPGPTDTPLFDAQPEKLKEALVKAIRFGGWPGPRKSPRPCCSSRPNRRRSSPGRCSASAAGSRWPADPEDTTRETP